MKLFKQLLAASILGVAFAGQALAAQIVCGGPSGNRTLTIDPGLTGGLCATQTGNLQNADITALGLTVVDWDTTGTFPNGDNSEGALQFTRGTTTSGNWSFLASLWNTYDRLFIAAHFGGGGNTANDNPDSFVVELSPFDFGGRYELGGGQLNGLSNIYLLGVLCPSTAPNCNCRPNDPNCGDKVPEPGTLFLLGVGALGLALRRRRLLA